MPAGIADFRAIAQTDAGRVVEHGAQLRDEGLSANWGRWTVQVATAFVQSFAQPGYVQRVEAENNAAIASFNNALTAEYGAAIGAALARPANGMPLSALQVRQVLQDPRIRLADLAAAAANPGNAALVNRALDHVMRDVRLPAGPQSRLMTDHIRQGLGRLLADVHAIDRTPDKSMLASLGTKMGERLNDYLLRGLSVYLDNHDQMNTSLAAAVRELEGRGGMAALRLEIPMLGTHLDVERNAFVTNTRQVLARVTGDLAGIGARFFGGAAPTGLADLHITDSDPHKGGNRVCILTFDNGQKIVYKPRDMRIDEAITGRAPQSGQPSLMEAASQRIAGNANALPTYTFMPRNDGENYGYVQHLSHGTPADHTVTPQQAAAFYRDMGRSAAVMALAGGTDLHHENMMVSGGRPHFTDLEFAFSRGVLSGLDGLLTGASNNWGAVAQRMLFDMALTHAVDTHSDATPWVVHGDRLVAANPMVMVDVSESLLALNTNGAITNNREHNLFRAYRNDFADGFKEALTAFRDHPGDYGNFIAGCANFQVRYHPMKTEDHRINFREYKNQMATADAGVGLVGNALVGDLAPLALASQGAYGGPPGEPVSDLRQSMLDAYAAHDIPFYSRVIGDTAVLRDGHESLDDYYFPQTNVGLANQVLASLPHVSDARIDAIGGHVATWLNTQQVTQGAVMQQEQRDLLAEIARQYGH